jgi:nucleoside-diphosphate-sugar epimerase
VVSHLHARKKARRWGTEDLFFLDGLDSAQAGGTVYAVGVKPLPANDLEHILAHTASWWEEARGKRFFLSGATGFLGAWLLESLLHANRALDLKVSATVLCRDPETFARRMPHVAGEAAITLWQGNVCKFDPPEHDFTYVIHAAAPTSAEASRRPLELLHTLIDGTRQMLEFASSRKTRRFLYVSSGAVYGRQPQHVSHLSEDYAGGPEWLTDAYAEGKRVAEQLCSIFAVQAGMEVKIARCFALVGPHLPLNAHFAIGNFIADALAARTIAIHGDGTPMRSYLYAADLAIWLWTILLRPNPSGASLDVWNVGSPEAVSIHELACMVAEEVHPGLAVSLGRTEMAGAPRQHYVPDVHKAEREWGLRQTIDLREAIRRTAGWYR